MNSDLIIIGGGVIGCAIAAELARQGLTVRLLERNQLGQEASWASAGMLAPQSEAEADGPLFRLCLQSRNLYSSFAAQLIQLTGLDPCYRQEGALQLAFDEQSATRLVAAHAWQFETDLDLKIEQLTPSQARELEPALSPNLVSALFFADEHQIDNRKLTTCLIAAAERSGVTIHPGVNVTSLWLEKGRVRGVVANGENYYADKVIDAAGSWASLLTILDGHLQLPKVTPVRGQMLALKLPAGRLNYVLHLGHNYFVPRWDGTLVVGSTTEYVGYDKRVTAAGLQSLLNAAQLAVPDCAQATFLEAWAGLRPGTADHLPLLGEHAELPGLIFATGHYRNGILLVPITAKLIAELVIGGEQNAIPAAFSPNRFAASIVPV